MKHTAYMCAVGGTALFLAGLFGQPQRADDSVRIGLPQDWSHRHVIFSAPNSFAASIKLHSENRHWQQLIRQQAAVLNRETIPAVEDTDADGNESDIVNGQDLFLHFHPRRYRQVRRVDWSVNLGSGGSSVAPAMYPAKYSFNVSAAPSCTNDFVVFALNVDGENNQAIIVGYNNLYTEPDSLAPRPTPLQRPTARQRQQRGPGLQHLFHHARQCYVRRRD